jgi:hypothetical protein
VKDFNDNFFLERGHKENGVLFFLFGIICLTLWLNRNDWVFRDMLMISSSREIIFKVIFFFCNEGQLGAQGWNRLRWRGLLK